MQTTEDIEFEPNAGQVVRMRFDGANPNPVIAPVDERPGTRSYFRGNDPSKWRTNIKTYNGMVIQDIYPSINLRYDSTNGQMKGTYTVAPGADPRRIRWRYEGPTQVRIDASTGDLRATLPPLPSNASLQPNARVSDAATTGAPANTLIEQAPVSWQQIGATQTPVTTTYSLAPDGSIGFALSTYDLSQPLVIDPILSYSAVIGGSETDIAQDIAVDGAGNVYISGLTESSDFPRQSGITPPSSVGREVFVTKLSADGKRPIYSAFFGGSSGEDLCFRLRLNQERRL